MSNSSADRALKVFLCHGSEDKAKVREIYMRLRQDGVDPWLDTENLIPGEEWDYAIKKAVRDSDAIMVFLSKKSASKEGYVQREIKIALDLAEEKPQGTIFIIPVKLEECDVPNRLSRFQYVEYDNENSHSNIVRALRQRSRGLNLSLLPGDGTLLKFNQNIQSVLGKKLYGGEDIQNLLTFHKDRDLRPEDVERLEPSVVVGLSFEAMNVLRNRFPDLERRAEEGEMLLSLIGITDPYEYWEEANQRTHCFQNKGDDTPSDESIQMTPVHSSNLRAIGYSDKTAVLQVDFLNGMTYQYYDVPAHLFSGIMSASSHGKYLDAHIKRGGFRYREM